MKTSLCLALSVFILSCGPLLTTPPPASSEAGSVCRAADPSNPCDVDDLVVLDPETQTTSCPARAGNPGTTCRAAAGACDVADVCDGIHESCPPDQLKAADTTCGATVVCRFPTRCTGTSPVCPTGDLIPAGWFCRAAPFEARDCDNGGVCDGAGKCVDEFRPAGTFCSGACTGTPICGSQNRCCTSTPGACNGTGSCIGATACTCHCSSQPC